MREVPQELARCFDPVVIGAAFARVLPECMDGTFQIQECQVEHPRYKSYRTAPAERSFITALYRLRGCAPGGIQQELIVTGKAYLPQMAAIEFQRLYAEGDVGVQLLPELGLMYRRFPDDPALPWLGELVSPAYLQQQLCGEFPAAAGIDWVVVNYRPYLRCTLRYRELAAEGAASVYVKTFANASGRESFARMRQIAAQARPEAFITPTPLRYDPAMNAVWVAGLHGRSLHPVTTELQDMRAVGRGLACLQGRSIAHLPVLTLDAYCAEAYKKLHKLCAVLPQYLPQFNLMERCLLHPPPEVPCRTLHGDFHSEQMLLTDGGIALFDYDELHLGDPLIDLANFIAAVLNLHGQAVATQWQRELLQGYAAVAGWPVCESRLHWHLAVQILTRAYRAFIQQRDDLQQHLHRLLMHLEQVCALIEPVKGRTYRHA